MSNAAVRLMLFVAVCSAWCGPGISHAKANEADDQFAVAADHYSAKRWDLAVEDFRKFIQDYPDSTKHAKALYFEAESLMQLDRNAEAYSLFIDVLAEEPSASFARPALFGAAEAAMLSGQVNEAQVRLLQFQSQYPADKLNAKVLMYRGDLAIRAGDMAQAEQFYRESLQRFADQPSADQCRLDLAHVFEVQKQFDEADQVLHEVAQHDHSPWAEMALLQLGAKQLATNKPQAALELYEAIEKRFPNTPLLPQTHLGCGRALFQLGHYAEAAGVLAPLTYDKQLGAAARYWVAMSQKEENKLKAAAAEKARQEEEAAQAAAAKSAKEWVAAPSTPSSSSVASAPQHPSDSRKSILSSRRDPQAAPIVQQPAPEVVAIQPTEIPNAEKPIAEKQITDKPDAEKTSTEKAIAESTPSPSPSTLASSTPKSGLQQPPSAAASASIDDQSRRRSAMIRYQQAEALVRAKQFDRAIGMLEIGDNTGDDPSSLSNRYLLAIALQGAKRDDEALQTLDDLSAVLQAKLVAADASFGQSPTLAHHSAAEKSDDGSVTPPAALSQNAIADATPFPNNNNSLSEQDLEALKTLNDNVQLARATSLLAREKFAEAIVPLQIYLATPRKDAGAERARSALAICLATVGRAEEAQQELAELKSNHPGSTLIPATTDRVAQAAYAAGLYKAAAPLFSDLAADGNPPELVAKGLSGAAWCHLKAGENQAANEAFAKFLERFPNDPRAAEAALARCQGLEHEGLDDAAIQAYRQAIKTYAQSKQMPEMLLAAAKLYDRLQRPEGAAPFYQRLVADFPNSPDADAALYSWGWSLRDLGRGADADKVFQLLYENYPKSRFWPDAVFRLAERASQQSNPETADSLLKQLVNTDCPAPVLQHALYLQGQIAINAQQWSAAEQPLSRLVREFPQGSLTLAAEFWLAETAYRAGDYVLSSERFEALAPRVTDHTEVWTGIVPLRRAQILAQRKRWTEARVMAESIANDFPQFAQQYEADFLIGRCLAADGDFDGARAAYEKVIHSPSGGKTEIAAMAQWMIGESYFAQNDFATALRDYLRVEVVYSYPRWQAAALLQAAKCYQQLGQQQEAAELYAKVLQTYPQTEFVAEASQRLIETTRK